MGRANIEAVGYLIIRFCGCRVHCHCSSSSLHLSVDCARRTIKDLDVV